MVWEDFYFISKNSNHAIKKRPFEGRPYHSFPVGEDTFALIPNVRIFSPSCDKVLLFDFPLQFRLKAKYLSVRTY